MKKKILVVEDEKPLRSILKKELERAGFDVIMAENGQEGIEKYLEFKPNLILTDIIMPVMDGKAMLAELEKKEQIPSVIVLSNFSDPEQLLEEQVKNKYSYFVKGNTSISTIIDEIKAKTNS